jgi:5-methyltetrahydrofolate--homocysteine methyltransferase
VLETMCDLEEAKTALSAARETRLPVVVCMGFDTGKDKDRTLMGTTPEQAATALDEAGADVIGANCGQGIEGFAPICRRLRSVTHRPIWLKPNAGLPVISHNSAQYTTSPEDFASHAIQLTQDGANFIGGCCGTTPEFIAAIVRQLHKTTSRPQ